MASVAKRVELVVILGAISAFAPLATDMYLPALPNVRDALHASASQVQDTVATFFLGFAAGQLLYGPITDRFGRKPPLYWGIGLFTITSALCAAVPSVDAMIVLRCIEALGACAGVVVSRAMVRDLFPPSEIARIFSTLMLVVILAPILAPLIGSYLLLWFGWRSIFWALTAAGAISLVAVATRLRESHPGDPGRSLAILEVLRVYAGLLRRPRYILSVSAGALAFAGMFAYIAGSPFVFIEWFGLAPQRYSWLFAVNAAGIMAVSQVNRALLRRWGPARLLRIAGGVQAVAGLALLAAAALRADSMLAFAAPLFVFVATIGAIGPNASAIAMAEEERNAGAASALLGAIQFAAGTASALTVGALHAVTPLPIAAIVAACGIGTVLLVRQLRIGLRN